MKKKILFFILVSALALTSIAQSTRYFEELLGRPNVDENTNVVLQLPSGSYVTFGEINSGDFIKTDAYGNLIFDSLYYDVDTVFAMLWEDAVIANDGNLVLAGWHGNGSDSTQQMWICKVDTIGQILWSNYVSDSLYNSIAY